MATATELVAGRKLDAEIARRVMRWNVISGNGDPAGCPPQPIVGLNETGPRHVNLSPVPRYSTDPAAARLVEDELERRGLHHEYSVLLAIDVFRTRHGWQDWQDTWAVIRATPQQRCRAALKSVPD